MGSHPAAPGSALYESPDMVAEYLLFHFGDPTDVLGDLPGPREAVGFASRLVTELLDLSSRPASAVDVGCAVGGSSFELARHCRSVIGIDFSQAFIAAATKLRTEGTYPTRKRIEADRFAPFTAQVAPDIDRSRTGFEVGDACALRSDLGGFDVVVAANLICRLPEPRAFLNRLPSLVNPGGQLLLTTPFTWMESYTPRERWLGGTDATGDSFTALREILSPHFDLELQIDLPFLIREHVRKFQYTVAIGSRWRRKS